MLKTYQTACLLIDCQHAFFDVQGTETTREVANTINRDVPRLQQHGVALHSIFSKARSAEQAGLLGNVQEYGFAIRKQHESAFRNTGLAERLNKSFRQNLILMGFHTMTCVRISAEDALHLGFNVFIDPSYVGEGMRGRNINRATIDSKERQALVQLGRKGVTIAPLSKFINLQF